MHNKPHTEEAKAKMRAAIRPKKWGWLPGEEITQRLLRTSSTTRSIAREYGCSDSTIKIIFRKYATPKERLKAKNHKAAESKKGKPNPTFKEWRRTHSGWTGQKHTKEARLKQSVAKLGKKYSLEKRIAQSARLQDISIENWEGFVSTKTDRLKSSKQYKDWRRQVFERDNWTCQECGVRNNKLHPHHIKAKSTHPELVFEVSNGITLCKDCHRKTDSYGRNRRMGNRIQADAGGER